MLATRRVGRPRKAPRPAEDRAEGSHVLGDGEESAERVHQVAPSLEPRELLDRFQSGFKAQAAGLGVSWEDMPG